MNDERWRLFFNESTNSSFTDLLRRESPQLLPTLTPTEGVTAVPHGTTVIAIRYRDGVI
ncbi:MAG: proteasome subunit beta, partial [Candidatus Rokubacteria bacterium]|nr:proteasome subunit beta [Candidatus Rokubacteria bacterium]